MIFGVGLGYRTAEFEAFGIRKGQRGQRFEECLAVAKRLWTEDTVSYESDTCILKNAHLSLKCVQKPHPPIWFAARHANAIRGAAQLARTLMIAAANGRLGKRAVPKAA
jgi:alkanesulfonate monooxygenase SsuD/methylene tetrahydromethanopterin reductase-like flavin-dependent oxidoreductase (luciferase family)